MSDLKYAIDTKKLQEFINENVTPGVDNERIQFEVDFNSSTGVIKTSLFASIIPPANSLALKGTTKTIVICPIPPGNCD